MSILGGGGGPSQGSGQGQGGIMGGTPMQTGRLNFPGMGGNMGLDMHRIPIIGNMFQNPYDQFKQQQMQNASAAYSMYRPEAAQSWMNAQNMQSQNLQPMNNALAAMYGSGATQGFQAQNPFGPTAFQRGAAVGTNPQMPTAPAGATGPGETMGMGEAPRRPVPKENQSDMYEPWRMGRYSDPLWGQQTDRTQGKYGANQNIRTDSSGPKRSDKELKF